MRWVQLRQQVARAAKSNGQRDSALARVDEQLRQVCRQRILISRIGCVGGIGATWRLFQLRQ